MPLSFRQRLTVFQFASACLLLVVVLTVVRGLLSQALFGQTDVSLQGEASELGAYLQQHLVDPVDLGAVVQAFATADAPSPGERLWLISAAGTSLLPGSPLSTPPPVPGSAVGYRTVGSGNAVARVLNVPVSFDGHTIAELILAQTLTAQNAAVQRAIHTILFVGVGALALAGIATAVVSNHVLQPLRLVTATMERIGLSQLQERIAYAGAPDEIGRLVAACNAMLERIELGYGEMRRFLDDVSHELRTPLTIVQGNVEVLRTAIGTADPEAETAVATIEDELGRVKRLIGDLLILARSEQLDFLRLRSIDVAEWFQALVAKLQTIAGERLRISPPPAATMWVDPDRLHQAVLNLVTNAIAASPPEAPIEVAGSIEHQQTLRITVSDHGAGVPPADRERLFERFYRGRADGSGTGLGLAIAQAVAVAHGGQIRIQARTTGGTMFTLDIPLQRRGGAPAAQDGPRSRLAPEPDAHRS